MTTSRSYRLAPLALALLLVLAGCMSAGSAPSPTPAAQTTATPDGASPDGGGEDGAQGPASYYGVDRRVIIRNAEMTLEVDDVESAFQDARKAIRRKGGFIADQHRTSEGDWVEGRFVVKVPATHFNAIRDQLAALGTLETSSYRAEDFTKRYAVRDSKIDQLEAREAELEAELADAEDPERVRLENELESVRAEIRQTTANQQALVTRSRFSTIVVQLHEPEGEKPPKNHETAFGFDDAVLEGLYGGLAVAKGAIVAVGFLVPVVVTLVGLLIGGLVLLAVLLAIRRHLAPRIWEAFDLDNRRRVDEDAAD